MNDNICSKITLNILFLKYKGLGLRLALPLESKFGLGSRFGLGLRYG